MVSYSILITVAISGFIGMLIGAGLENLMRAANTRISEENEVCADLAQKVLDMQDIILELQAQKTAPVVSQKTIGGQVYTPVEKHDLNEDFQIQPKALAYKAPEIVAKSKFGPHITKALILGIKLVRSYNGYQLVTTEKILTSTYRSYFWVSLVGAIKVRVDVETDITSLEHATKMYNYIMEAAILEGFIEPQEVA